MFSRIFAFPLTILTAALIAQSCQRPPEGADEGPVTIVFKHGKVVGDPRPIRELIEKFEKENPGIKVVEETLPAATDEQHQFYVINLEGGSGEFDVFALDVIWGPEFARAGWLRDLSHTMPPEKREIFFSAPMEAVTWRGGIYAVPWYMDAGILYYRKDLLEKHGFEPPRTWDELVRISKAVMEKEPGLYGFVWQGKQYEGLVCDALEFIWSAGGAVLEGGEVVIDSSQNVKALTFMRDLVYKHGVTPELVTTAAEEQARLIFGKGAAVFMRNWPYAWSIYEREGSPVKGKVGVSVLPHFEGGRSAAALGGWQLGVNARSRRPEEAEKLVEFLTSYEAQKLVAMTIGFKPSLKALYKDPELVAAQPFIPRLYEVFEAARPRPVTPHYIRVSQALQTEFSAVLARMKTPEEALRSARKKIERIIEER